MLLSFFEGPPRLTDKQLRAEPRRIGQAWKPGMFCVLRLFRPLAGSQVSNGRPSRGALFTLFLNNAG